ncbi:MAG: urease accessory protein UreD [Ginsengibacter sp.]
MKSKLHITAGYNDHKTYLRQSYCEHPFKLADLKEDHLHDFLCLVIRSTSPGMLDNDHYGITIDVEENAHLQVKTQAYQRLYTMVNEATQHINVHMGNRGSFYFLPHPCVPHKASNFSGVNHIYLSAKHNLIWSDVITCGRKHSGEVFEFTKFSSITNVYINHKLVVRENILLEPSATNINGIGQFEGFTHQSTLLFLHDDADLNYIMDSARLLLSAEDDILFGISKLPVNGLIFRILGYKGEQLFGFNQKISSIIQKITENNILTKKLI